MYRIKSKKELAPTIKEIEVEAGSIAQVAKPGQFVMIKTNTFAERIPLTLYNFNKEDGTISLIFQEVGLATKKLGALNVGDFIEVVVGPLGLPMKESEFEDKFVVGIGGGVGGAPLIAKLRALKNARIITILGARSKEFLILKEEFESISERLIITTDDGTYGMKGLVTDALSSILEEELPEVIIAIGPVVMMEKVCQITKPYNIKTFVSLNPIMVDGIGMCGSCRVRVGGKIQFACVDGPVFDGHLVDFKDLMIRNNRFIELERKVA